ncbi:hypothetical protein CJP72_06415 [Citrobacter sp. NCU1]|nr:hypothetical protein [Citrobacter sp. NCU1]
MHKGKTENFIVDSQGMTLRDYFAAKSMAVAWSALEGGYFEAEPDSSADKMAECAYQLADAMLRAREAS